MNCFRATTIFENFQMELPVFPLELSHITIQTFWVSFTWWYYYVEQYVTLSFI